jgi:hypothetical protein
MQLSMSLKKCGFSFNCAALLQQPELKPGTCPNYHTCRTAADRPDDESFELVIAPHPVQVTAIEAATLMLRMRGNPQSPESLGLWEAFDDLDRLLEDLQQHLQRIEQQADYIAPKGCEVHRYNVKRPAGIYEYHKLASSDARFEPSEQEDAVKVIHLSRAGDPRERSAKAGIARRNQLLKARTLLNNAGASLRAATELLSEE